MNNRYRSYPIRNKTVHANRFETRHSSSLFESYNLVTSIDDRDQESYSQVVRTRQRTRLHFSSSKVVVTFQWTRTRAERKRHDIPVHVEIDVLENVVFTVLVKQHLVSRSSSSCRSERAGHSTASSRSPGFCRCATRVFRSTLLWRQLEAWQVGSALHAIRRQGGPKVCPINGPPLPFSAYHHRLFLHDSLSFFLFLLLSSFLSSFLSLCFYLHRSLFISFPLFVSSSFHLSSRLSSILSQISQPYDFSSCTFQYLWSIAWETDSVPSFGSSPPLHHSSPFLPCPSSSLGSSPCVCRFFHPRRGSFLSEQTSRTYHPQLYVIRRENDRHELSTPPCAATLFHVNEEQFWIYLHIT